MMKILIVGSGGREHAIGWKLKQSSLVGKIYFAPGNGGTEKIGENINIAAEDIKELLRFVLDNKIDLTFVGPEAPLSQGIVDVFEKKGLRIFGPTKRAARLESDKAWAAGFMKRYLIPLPKSYVFNEAKKAIAFVNSLQNASIVIKACGLAQGKGVIIPVSIESAIEAIKKIMVNKEFGEAGKRIVIQEKISGPEVSVLAFCDGKNIVSLIPAQDHKRVFDNNQGPNTGGMGAYAPLHFVDKKMMGLIYDKVLHPTVEGMRKEGCPYRGVLYAGLMLTEEGPKVLEYNCRFGDPETQPLMMLLQSDLLKIVIAVAEGKLEKKMVRFKKGVSVCVVLTSRGYPGKYKKGEVIYGLDKLMSSLIHVFHAGTRKENNQITTASGRVLGVTSYGSNFNEAVKRVYRAIGKKGVYFKNMHYRRDIGKNRKVKK
jgi:phosphoribosylamine--glycine ligase